LVTVGFMGPALLLAFVFHQGVAAVATAVVGTLPALYLAWAVVPAARKPGPRLSLVPAVPGWVDRGELAEVVSALTGTGSGAVALTTGLVGAGGFGKTTLEQIFTGKESTELGESQERPTARAETCAVTYNGLRKTADKTLR
jgi:hypothetical protein